MDPVRNPFAPGAGSPPPELAGRDDVINDAEVAVQRLVQGRAARSQILLGLRGVGKTVLLNKIQTIAERHNCLTSFIEAPENKALADLLYPHIFKVLRQLSAVESAKSATHAALRALRSFASAFKIHYEEYSLSVDPEPGTSDTGNLETDLPDLFLRIGAAAKAAGKGWALLIDEVQYLKGDELSALVVAIHRANQRQLPVMFFGAGLPQLAGLMGEAKSYSERLFAYPAIGPLDEKAAAKAIREPIQNEGEQINEDALQDIVIGTHGYPYFLQEWGYQAWNTAESSPITKTDVQTAAASALKRLDEGFFLVRYDRLTPKEREYVQAMASLGKGPYRSADVADTLKVNVQTLAPRRAAIIQKGMIYSPAHGDIAFTVPMFDDFLRRISSRT
ncbi:MAG: ATP-binding protein [Hyphomonas sp.]|uniref:ATP-binding protein n=1 Tax=Hyphomonas sp. TaxID=87 RepID=UPI0017C01902|nr:ATP-binding protein [Hyphomonas sp.]MBA3069618.1 ATP-binding protein [Hyphomonas sp.]MBU3921289.1 ATP-binding protein [Alphaproteobacteria bacterium]MBU4063221.1 ATP-binding protein [Alphaproteobacteria bacterium]MBU4164039.1 ATP-binding protein [Alphaproteobacteria bacterium]